ncbi:hypothetical protein M758_5G164100 [Ceratodon purpureus]|nr:hypothetical protein M758_5G164100 [Ceratodon purpureus]
MTQVTVTDNQSSQEFRNDLFDSGHQQLNSMGLVRLHCSIECRYKQCIRRHWYCSRRLLEAHV